MCSVLSLHEREPVQIPADISLCRTHFNRIKSSECDQCNVFINPASESHTLTHDLDRINSLLQQEGKSLTITDSNTLCDSCYLSISDMLKQEEHRNARTRDISLLILTQRQIIATGTGNVDPEDIALAEAVIYTYQRLEGNQPLLLKQVVQHYQSNLSTMSPTDGTTHRKVLNHLRNKFPLFICLHTHPRAQVLFSTQLILIYIKCCSSQ